MVRRDMRAHPAGSAATIIGEVAEAPTEAVVLQTAFGGECMVDMPSGKWLPRIC